MPFIEKKYIGTMLTVAVASDIGETDGNSKRTTLYISTAACGQDMLLNGDPVTEITITFIGNVEWNDFLDGLGIVS